MARVPQKNRLKHLNTIPNTIFIATLTIGIFSIIGLGGLWIYGAWNQFDKESALLRRHYEDDQKRLIKFHVNESISDINARMARIRPLLEADIQFQATEKYNEISNLYQQLHTSFTSSGWQRIITEILPSSKTGTNHPINFCIGLHNSIYIQPKAPGANTVADKSAIGAMLASLSLKAKKILMDKPGEVVPVSSLPVPVAKEMSSFLICAKYFEPLDILIGAAADLALAEQRARNRILQHLNEIRFGPNGYIFVHTFDGVTLVHINPKVVGINVWNLEDADGVKYIQELTKVSKQPGGGYVRYRNTRPTAGRQTMKIAYARAIPSLKWVVGTGVYIDDIEDAIIDIKTDTASKIRHFMIRAVILLAVFLGLVFFFGRHIAKRTRRDLDAFADFFHSAAFDEHTKVPDSFSFDEFKHLSELAGEMINHRRKAKQELLQEKIFSEAVINSLPGAFYAFDQDLRLRNWNKNFQEITGYSDLELQNFKLADWIEETEFNKNILPKVHNLFNTGKTLIAETNIKRKDGSKLPMLATGSLLEINNNKYLIGSALDISPHKTLETKLRQAQKMEAIGTLAGGIAHDFNNILSVIFGFTELAMLQINDTNAVKNNLQEVRKGAQRARELVRQILTFSRRSEQDKQPLQMALVIKEALKMLRATIPANINIQQDIASKSLVMADPTQIHQIIMNLCTNSYQAMRKTGGVLHITLLDTEITDEDMKHIGDVSPGPYLMLEVADTGTGMEQTVLEKIFEPYFTTKETGEGTGLGLAVVLGIVQSHHGAITVQSTPGQGTTIRVYLPRTQQIAGSVSQPENVRKSAAGNERILFLDDEEKIGQVVREVFECYGYTVTVFTEPSLALEEIENHPELYALVITDMTMPAMLGTEVTEKIKRIRPDLPVVLGTGYNDLIDRDKAIHQGITDFIQKPYIMTDLLRTVRSILDRYYER